MYQWLDNRPLFQATIEWGISLWFPPSLQMFDENASDFFDRDMWLLRFKRIIYHSNSEPIILIVVCRTDLIAMRQDSLQSMDIMYGDIAPQYAVTLPVDIPSKGLYRSNEQVDVVSLRNSSLHVDDGDDTDNKVTNFFCFPRWIF